MSYDNPTNHLILIDNRNNLTAFHFQEPGILHLQNGFTLSGHIHEASDIVVHNGNLFITDYKAHSIVVFSLKGNLI